MITDNQQKISMLKTKVENLNQKIRTLTSQKKDYEKQIKDLEEQDFLNVIKANGCTVPTLRDDLALAKILRDNNLTQDDVLELLNLNNEGENNNEEYQQN
ncbi:MAG: hypothetical protein UD936_06765 [Acutalibacteraceae bacterium]|nr:hypothetical protein [Acutalibacteraceae bacterium]